MKKETIIRRLNKAKPNQLWQIGIDDPENYEEFRKQVGSENLDYYIPAIEYDGSLWGIGDTTEEEMGKIIEKEIVGYLSDKSLRYKIVKCRASTKVLWVELDESKDGTTNIDADVIQAFVDYIKRAFTSKHK